MSKDVELLHQVVNKGLMGAFLSKKVAVVRLTDDMKIFIPSVRIR